VSSTSALTVRPRYDTHCPPDIHGFAQAICLHGKMNQAARLGALQQFKSNTSSILLATDVASRGLDIPSVDLVCNFSIPTNVKDYVHRVGRTARAGRSGRALNFVTQYVLFFVA